MIIIFICLLICIVDVSPIGSPALPNCSTTSWFDDGGTQW